jgi:hypothetical protein
MKNSVKNSKTTAASEVVAARHEEQAAPLTLAGSAAADDNIDFGGDDDANRDPFWEEVDGGAMPPGLSRMWVQEHSKMIRLPTQKTVKAKVHFAKPKEGKGFAVQCNGSMCALCLGGNKPVEQNLLLVFDVEERDLAVLAIDQSTGPSSLRQQLRPHMRSVNFFLLVLELAKVGQRYRVSLSRDLGQAPAVGDDFGDSVLATIAKAGLPTEDDVLASYEKRSNSELLEDMPEIERAIRLRHADLDMAALRAL